MKQSSSLWSIIASAFANSDCEIETVAELEREQSRYQTGEIELRNETIFSLVAEKIDWSAGGTCFAKVAGSVRLSTPVDSELSAPNKCVQGKLDGFGGLQ